MLGDDCLQFGLSEEEREAFNTQGFVVVRDAVSEPVAADLERALDAIHQNVLATGYDPYTMKAITPKDTFFALTSCIEIPRF